MWGTCFSRLVQSVSDVEGNLAIVQNDSVLATIAMASRSIDSHCHRWGLLYFKKNRQ